MGTSRGWKVFEEYSIQFCSEMEFFAPGSVGFWLLSPGAYIIVANRPVLTGTVPIFGLLSRSCPGRAVQTGGVRSNCQRSCCQRARRQLVCKCPIELQSNSRTTNFMTILIHTRYLFILVHYCILHCSVLSLYTMVVGAVSMMGVV